MTCIYEDDLRDLLLDLYRKACEKKTSADFDALYVAVDTFWLYGFLSTDLDKFAYGLYTHLHDLILQHAISLLEKLKEDIHENKA